MQKQTLQAPKGVKYIGDWPDFWDELPKEPLILNKRLTGCGFTQDAIMNSSIAVVLASPRRALVETKHAKHPHTFLYLPQPTTSKAKAKDNPKQEESLKKQLEKYLAEHDPERFCYSPDGSVNYSDYRKVLTTYDSLPKVIEILSDCGVLHEFTVIVDEFQNILIDVFKASTEWQCLKCLDGLKKVMYVSATPVEEDYLDMVDEFKLLPYWDIEWDKDVISCKPLHLRQYHKIHDEVSRIVKLYRQGNSGFSKVVNGEIKVSTEAVFFINSVSTIISLLPKLGLKQEEVNVICSNTSDNRDGLNKIGFSIGSIPKEGETHKMFTFCTSTVYMGVDFYSTSAVTFVFAELHQDSMIVDISCEIPQIQGRQRLDDNPFKNDIYLYVSKGHPTVTAPDEFDKMIERKSNASEKVMTTYNGMDQSGRDVFLPKLRTSARCDRYKLDYIDVVKDPTTGMESVIINNLVKASEIRATKIIRANYNTPQQIIDATDKVNYVSPQDKEFEAKWISNNNFQRRMKLYCEAKANGVRVDGFCYIEPEYHLAYIELGEAELKRLGYRRSAIEKELAAKSKSVDVAQVVQGMFEVGKWYSTKEINEKLSTVYALANIKRSAKAAQIESYFDVKACQSKKRRGYQIINIK